MAVGLGGIVGILFDDGGHFLHGGGGLFKGGGLSRGAVRQAQA